MPLSAQFFLVHGITDARCPIDKIQKFHKTLSKKGKTPLFLHQGSHNFPKHTAYPQFIATLMEGKDTNSLEAAIGLKRANPND